MIYICSRLCLHLSLYICFVFLLCLHLSIYICNVFSCLHLSLYTFFVLLYSSISGSYDSMQGGRERETLECRVSCRGEDDSQLGFLADVHTVDRQSVLDYLHSKRFSWWCQCRSRTRPPPMIQSNWNYKVLKPKLQRIQCIQLLTHITT